MSKYILSLDQGTTSSRAIIFDRNCHIAASSQREFTQLYPKEGWVEHNPMEIYSSQYLTMTDAIAKSGIQPADIAAIGIANQRETVIMWEKDTGTPVYNAIVWQCRRSAAIAADLKQRGLAQEIKKRTGLMPDAYFSATKIKWLLDNVDGFKQRAQNGEILFGTVDTWLVWKLTGGKVHVTDRTNASRTMLYNINTLEWDDYLLDIFDIPKSILPTVCTSSEIYGYAEIEGVKIPIAGIAGDQQAALFGQACFEPGEAKNTYGTGCFLLVNTGDKPIFSQNGLITTIAAGSNANVQYALEGSVFSAGSVIQWLRDELRLFSDSKDAEYFAQKVESTGGVYVVPAFTGLGAPHWDMYARGTITGITRGTKREHIIRAAQEAIAYQSYDLVKAMEKDTKINITDLNVDGGASRDSFLMQFQADILNISLKRPKVMETTALGVMFLAGLATGFFKDLDEIKEIWKFGKVFAADMQEAQRQNLLKGWNKAVGRSLGWEKED